MVLGAGRSVAKEAQSVPVAGVVPAVADRAVRLALEMVPLVDRGAAVPRADLLAAVFWD